MSPLNVAAVPAGSGVVVPSAAISTAPAVTSTSAGVPWLVIGNSSPGTSTSRCSSTSLAPASGVKGSPTSPSPSPLDSSIVQTAASSGPGTTAVAPAPSASTAASPGPSRVVRSGSTTSTAPLSVTTMASEPGSSVGAPPGGNVDDATRHWRGSPPSSTTRWAMTWPWPLMMGWSSGGTVVPGAAAPLSSSPDEQPAARSSSRAAPAPREEDTARVVTARTLRRRCV